MLLFVEKNGWPSAEDKDELNKSSVDKYANMQRLVMDWSRNDQGVKSAFDSVIQRKPKNKEFFLLIDVICGHLYFYRGSSFMTIRDASEVI